MNKATTNGSRSAIYTTHYWLIDGFSMMAFVAATEPLRIANRMAGRTCFSWRLASTSGGAITASNGMRVLADTALADIGSASRLAVCSGFFDDAAIPSEAIRQLRAMSAAGTVLGGIDTGCFILAKAGLLDGYTATLHWESLAAFSERFPMVHARESLYEIDRNRFSCAGGMAATDMALAEIGAVYSPELADAVAEQLIHDRARDPATRQRLSIVKRLGIHQAALVKAIALMESHLETPLTLADIAERIERSPRQLQRLFETELSSTPRAWYRDLRLAHAKTLVEQTDRSLTEIATAAGFVSGASFSRAFRHRFETSPSSYRRRANEDRAT